MKLLLFVDADHSEADFEVALSALGEAVARGDIRVVKFDNALPQIGRADGGVGFDAVDSSFREDRERRLAAVLAAGAGNAMAIDWQDPAWSAITMIADTDAVLVVGTGTSGSRAHDFYGLSAIVSLARNFSKPVAIVQQSLVGPMDDRDRELLKEAFDSASLIGVIDEESRDLAVAWGASPSRVRVDPIGLFAREESTGAVSEDRDGYIVANFGFLDGLELYRRPIAELLEWLPSLTGLSSVRAAADPASIAGASLVISTNARDLDVTLSKGVPFVAMGTDERVAHVAARLHLIGMSEWALSPSSLGSRDAELVLAETWSRRAEIRDHLSAAAVVQSAAARQWWDDAITALEGGDVRESDPTPTNTLQLIDRLLAERVAFARDMSRLADEDRTRTILRWRARVDELGVFVRRVDHAELIKGELHAQLLDAEKRVGEAEIALRAAHSLAAEVAEPAFARALRPPIVHYPEGTITEILRTKTMRWTRRLRRVYGIIRFRDPNRHTL